MAHGFTIPVSGSRHLSRSTPTNGGTKTNPIPAYSSNPFRTSSASLNAPHVVGFVVLALLPPMVYGTFVFLLSTSSSFHSTHCGTSRSSVGIFVSRFGSLNGGGICPPVAVATFTRHPRV